MNAPSPVLAQKNARPAPELSVVIPTFNAQDSIASLIEGLARALAGVDWEMIVVDDNSADQTVSLVRRLGETDPRVRAIRRVGRSGLTQTCLVTMLASRARFVAMIQPEPGFDATVLVAMLERLRGGDADLVAATRGRAASGRLRALVRATLSGITRRALSTGLSDPTSGFFMMRRDALEGLTPSLSSLGYQVLLDLIATARGRLRIVELAGRLDDGARDGGRSELQLALELLALLAAKFSNDAVSIRFLLFCMVGLSGVGVHLVLLKVALISLPFTAAQTAATVLTTVWNYSLNNTVTYGDQRLSGWSYVTGLIRFQIVCGIGLVSNVGVASLIYANDSTWWIAGLGGAVMGAVWNYAVSSVFVWRPR
jgi:dolichol-phosphate mannosyltransferase